MSVKRISDHAGIDNDMIVVDLSDADGEAERAAIIAILDAGDPGPRIAKLRDFPELATRVAWLERRLASAGEDDVLHERLRAAEAIWYKLSARPALVRDGKRQAGTAKGGKARPAPAWHALAFAHARVLLASGSEKHELVAKVARKFKRSTDAASRVLQGAGMIEKRKSRT